MATSKKKKSNKESSLAGSTDKAAKLPYLTIPDFDPVEADRVLSDAVLRLRTMSKRAGELAAKLESLAAGGTLAGLSLAQAPSDIAEDAVSLAADIGKDAACLERIAPTIQRWALGERRSRRARFDEIAGRRGWSLIGTWPEPVIDGIVFIKIDEDRNRAWVNGQPLRGNPTAEKLATHTAQEIEELTRRRSDPATFVADAWTAFGGAAVPIGQGLDVYRLLRELLWIKQAKSFRSDPRPENFRPYSAAQFRADLTHYLASGAPAFLDGGKQYRLDAVGGSFAQDALFMYFPQTGRLASCGRLTFRAVEPGGDQ